MRAHSLLASNAPTPSCAVAFCQLFPRLVRMGRSPLDLVLLLLPCLQTWVQRYPNRVEELEAAKECIRATGDLVDTLNTWTMLPVLSCILTVMQFPESHVPGDPSGLRRHLAGWQHVRQGRALFSMVQTLTIPRLRVWLQEWDSTLRLMVELSMADIWIPPSSLVVDMSSLDGWVPEALQVWQSILSQLHDIHLIVRAAAAEVFNRNEPQVQ